MGLSTDGGTSVQNRHFCLRATSSLMDTPYVIIDTTSLFPTINTPDACERQRFPTQPEGRQGGFCQKVDGISRFRVVHPGYCTTRVAVEISYGLGLLGALFCSWASPECQAVGCHRAGAAGNYLSQEGSLPSAGRVVVEVPRFVTPPAFRKPSDQPLGGGAPC